MVRFKSMPWLGRALVALTCCAGMFTFVTSCGSTSNVAGDDPASRDNDGVQVGGSAGGGGGSGTDANGNENDNDDVIAALFRDSDGDGTLDIYEVQNGTDPLDPTEGGDIDGDGVPNQLDNDVDGDGADNSNDPDIDGDGIANGDDDDVDGDGEDNDEDDDDDGDGTPDDEDEDDDNDGEDDCDCEHGVCSSFGGLCFCDPGWKGEDCDEFHCNDIRCHNGTCVGPNTCRCNPGWESVGTIACAVYHCRQARNCNGHGQCIGPNVCQCDSDWRGLEDCSLHTCDRNPSLCDDGNSCTIDTCVPSSGCENEPIVCTLFEVCINGECTSPCNSAADCEDGQGCRDGGCFDCEDDSECRDGDPCTGDTCNAQNECENEPVVCAIFEECVLGKCVEGCFNESDCSLTQSCRDGGCFEDCSDSADCDDGEVCDDDVCIPEDQEDEDEDDDVELP
jgi:hypothetical protein